MKIYKALKFAEEKHKGQKRRVSQEPYITHPLKVSYLLANYKKSKKINDLIIASILHDTLEDTNTSIEEITENFGELVSSLVAELTSSNKEMKKYENKNEYLKQKMLNMSSYALTIKLVDRFANITDKPKPTYLEDTKKLISYLENNRELNVTQKSIIIDMKKELN